MYGSVAGVAALARVWTRDGEFADEPDVYGTPATNPTLTTVTSWLSQISGAFDAAVANQGFQTPVVEPRAVVAIGLMVEQYVSDLCHAANSRGRFFTDHAIERGVVPINVIRKDIAAWVNENTTGLELLGVPRIPDKEGKNEMIFDVI